MKQTPIVLLLCLLSLNLVRPSPTPPPTSNGYPCSTSASLYPCQSYAYYLAGADPTLLDLANIADLFNLPRRTIANATNNLTSFSTLSPSQPLLVPLTCACHVSTTNISSFDVPYVIAPGDNYYAVSSFKFGNLTSYPAVIKANPDLVPTNLSVGADVTFPIFCGCPPSRGGAVSMVTYSFQPGDTFSKISTDFGTDVESLTATNGKESSIKPFTTILIPVSSLPPPVIRSYTPPTIKNNDKSKRGVIAGLAAALGVISTLWAISMLGILWMWKKRKERTLGEEEGRGKLVRRKDVDEKLMSDISEWLDKYKVFGIGELEEATAGFSESSLIQGTVYKGVMDGEVYAIKKMKWNARDELKILQKVNHTNLVKLEGFCIEPEDGTCYLIYEYIENGSLHSWLHDSARAQKLDWRARLRIALDLAHGLQYVHEHTWPRVVHKDIKSSNVLLDSKLRAKVANFGLAKSGCNAVTTNIVGTQGYVSPEYLVDGLVTTKMDVFAYGVVLLELVSGKEAVSEKGEMLWMEAEEIFANTDGRFEGKILSWMDKRMIMPEESANMESIVNVMHIARACLQKDPAKRPSMVDVAYTLSKADELYSDFSDEGLMVGGGGGGGGSEVMAR